MNLIRGYSTTLRLRSSCLRAQFGFITQIWFFWLAVHVIYLFFMNGASIRIQCELVTVLNWAACTKEQRQHVQHAVIQTYTWRPLKSAFTFTDVQRKPVNSCADNNEDEKNFSLWLFVEQWLLFLYRGVCGCGVRARSGGTVTSLKQICS